MTIMVVTDDDLGENAMRRAGLFGCLLGALILGPPAHADTTVDYKGLRITVPAGWPVYRLGPGSTECLRYDRHAVYLGPAGENQVCPAHAVGRTEALHVEPLTEQTASFASDLLGGRSAERTRLAGMPAVTVRDAATGEIRAAVPGAGVLVTGSYGPGPRELEHVLGEITPVPRDNERRGGERNRWVTGMGFDTCSAPSLAAMHAWREHFVAANIYIGGPARACPDGRLSRSWVAAVRAMGWRLIPTYVGPQAPCASSRPRFSLGTAAIAGQLSAVDAVSRAVALGLPPRTPIYMDMEAYGRGATCREAVLIFLDSWTRAIHALEYTPGVYSSVASGIRDLGEATGISKPTEIWFAHWDKKADVHGDRYLEDDWWPGHHRIKQFRGDHFEKHGGVRLHIDSDDVDGHVH
ncbi:hypothetical protein GCM10027176_57890 [Actinoallomurus bryophytorum]